MPLRTYDPKQVILTVGGVPINGFADGSFIEYEDDEDSFQKVSGADGIVSRSNLNNNSGMITITLAQTSPSNDYLSALNTQDKKLNTGVVPVILKDNSGTTNLFSPNGWVRRKANGPLAKEISNRDWVIELTDVDGVLGGNV